VKEGSIIEYKYTLKSPYISTLPEWNFQREIPVLFSECKVNIPEYYKYNVYRKGTVLVEEVKNKLDKKIAMVDKYRDIHHHSAAVHSYDVNYTDHQTIYKAENVPALKDESYVNNIENYMSSIQHELQSVQFPQTPYEYYASDWDNVVKKIYEDSDFGSQLNKSGYFDNDLNALLKGVTDKNEKIAIIFNYVKSRMNWDGIHAYSCDKGVSAAYNDKTGNSAEINLMLVAMLRYAGIDVSPVILSTRANGIALYPSRSAFNYVIAGVELTDNLLLLDATNKNALPNILPIRDLNWIGRIIRKDGTSAQIDLSSNILSKEITNLMATLNAKGEIEGKIKSQKFDYNAFVFRENDGRLAKENYLEKMEKELNGSIVEEYVVENKTELDKPIAETFSFKNSNSVEVIGDKMYFSPLLFFSETVNPFQQETREYPVDFVFPNQEKYLTIISIPEGYVVESMPAPVAIVFTDELLSYKFNISSNGKQIQVSSVFDVKTSVLSPEDYEELKKFYSEMIKKQTEKVVLKKA
jgi:hypothetical protein